MKLILLVVVCCLVLHNGKGAPRNARYMLVRCSPDGDQANCVTQQTPEMTWSPDLPAKLPASIAQFLEAESVEDKSPLSKEEEEEEIEEEEETKGAEEEEKTEEEEEEAEEAEEAEEEEEEEEEETEEAEDKEWETEEDEKMPLISGSSVPLSESGSGDFEGSADASVGPGDIGSGDSWTEDLAVVGKSRPSESQARLAEPELHEDHLLST